MIGSPWIARAGDWLREKLADWLFPESQAAPVDSLIETTEDAYRISRYTNFRRLFIGQQQKVFFGQILERLGKKSKYATTLYTSYNLPSLIIRKFADLAVGNPPIFEYEDEAQQVELDGVFASSDFWRDLYSLVCAIAYKGDGILMPVIRNGEVRIKTMRPENWFPTIDGDGNISEAKFVWIENHEIAGLPEGFIREEVHKPGEIQNNMWKMARDGQSRGDKINIKTFYPELEERQATGVDEILPVHFSNYRIDDSVYGVSDYLDVASLFEALSSRLTQVCRILDIHSDPVLFAPFEAFEKDAKSDKMRFRYAGAPVVPVDADRTKENWGYLTWDGQLASNFTVVDRLVHAIAEISEISPRLLGLDASAAAESAEKMKLTLINTIAKVRRKQNLLGYGFEELFRKAFKLGGAWGILSGDPSAKLGIYWEDALPEDRLYQAQVEAIRTGGRATSSVESAIERLDGAEGAEEELSKISGEKPKLEIPAGYGEPDGGSNPAEEITAIAKRRASNGVVGG